MSNGEKTKLLYIGVTAIQNGKPFRIMQQQLGVDQTLLLLADDAGDLSDPEYLNKSAFDHDSVSGYHVVHAKPLPFARKSGPLTGFSWDAFRFASRSDIVVVYGHYLVSFWLAMFAAKLRGRKLMLTTDATYAEGSAASKSWLAKVKPAIFRWLYQSWADGVFVPSNAARLYLESLGVGADRITVTPYVVDEDHIKSVSESTDVSSMRERLGIPQHHTVFIFCAKFLERKRPSDVISAFHETVLKGQDTSLILIGAGPLEEALRDQTRNLGLTDRVHFTGLVKYSELPRYYTAADVLVVSSDHEPYGLPVNEAMLCGRPAIVTDRVGARLDLVEEGETGWIYPAGQVSALAEIMQQIAARPDLLPAMGEKARQKMASWSSETNVRRQLEYFQKQGWLASSPARV